MNIFSFKLRIYFLFFVSYIFFLTEKEITANQYVNIQGVFPQSSFLTVTFFTASDPEGKHLDISFDSSTVSQSLCIDDSFKYELTRATTIKFSFPKELSQNLLIERITIDNVVNISPVILQNSTISTNEITTSVLKYNNNFYYKIHKIGKDYASITLEPSFFYQACPVGLQLFLRLSLCAALLFLIGFLHKQASTQRLLIIGIAFFLATLPLKMDWSNWCLGLIGALSIVSFILNKERKIHWQPIYFMPIVVFLLYLIGTLYVANIKDGLKEIHTSFSFIIFPVIFSIIYLKRENTALLLRFFIRAMMTFCIFGLLSYATILSEFDLNVAFRDSKHYAPLLLMWPALAHPSMVAIILLMAIPTALYLRYEVKNISIYEFVLCLVLITIFPILTGARIGMLIAPILIGLGFLYYSKINRYIKTGLVSIGVLACLLMFFKYPQLNEKFSDPIRTQLQTTAIDAIKEKPIFGWGTGSMQKINSSEERLQRLGYTTAIDSHTHNQYLDMAVQFGIPGILLIIGLLAWCLVLSFRNKDFLLLSFVVLYGIFMLVESPWATVKGIQPFMFWLCFLVATQKVRLSASAKE